MKFYRKQIVHVKAVEKQKQQERQSVPEKRTITPDQEARVRFMQNIVRQARVDQ